MLDRRTVLLCSTALAATAMSGSLSRAAAPASESPLNTLFDGFMAHALHRSPILATQLGLDKGPYAETKFRLDDLSLAAVAADKRTVSQQLRALDAFDRRSLKGEDAISYDTVFYSMRAADAADHRYKFGAASTNTAAPRGAGVPYVVSQFNGSYQSVPDFLDSQHTIETKNDADAYLSRLTAFAKGLDQETEAVRHDAGQNVIPPDFILSRTLDQMRKLRAQTADQSVLVRSVAQRTKSKGITGDYQTKASQIVTSSIYPALDRQIATLESLKPRAKSDAGVWALKDGGSYYADSLTYWTTDDKNPEEIHRIGLDLVRSYTARIDAIMKVQGLTKGTVGERLRAMYNDPKFRYSNDDAGKEKLIADLNVKVHAVRAMLPKYFRTLPKADVMIKRVPKYIEEGQAGGYYNSPSLDGSRPGIYYINLRNTAEVPSWTLPTLTYHEAIPGHHLQGAIQQEVNLPLIRKVSFFSAYAEGWALYAEELADEMGLYKNDPFGRIGYLHDAMFRAVRLVVDTGIHTMRWSRDKAIAYYVGAIGDPVPAATTEVERYCVWPGQACSYMLGKLAILRLREKAKKDLGAKFDLRDFHDAVLRAGAMPLHVLDTVVDDYIRKARG
jgi:uncharacterized protein (DUF885 family)